jgi:DNA primase
MAAWLTPIVDDAHTALMASPSAMEARTYLTSRGVTTEEMVRFRLGYGDPSITIGACTDEFGQWSTAYFFRKIILPLTSLTGDYVGLQTRSLGEKGYRQFFAYSPEVYPFVFGAAQAAEELWRTKRLVIVEGAFDCLAAAKVAPNTVATLTASVPSTLRRFFRRYVASLTVFFDMDEPGRTAAESLASDPMKTYHVTVPAYPAHDPADLLHERGVEVLRRLLSHASIIAESPILPATDEQP